MRSPGGADIGVEVIAELRVGRAGREHGDRERTGQDDATMPATQAKASRVVHRGGVEEPPDVVGVESSPAGRCRAAVASGASDLTRATVTPRLGEGRDGVGATIGDGGVPIELCIA